MSGAGFTQAFGLNSTGATTGYYWNIGDNTYVGFVRTPDGTITTFSTPDAPRTVPIAISDNGTVVRYYDHPSSSGFVRSPDGTIVSFDPPNSKGVTVVGMNRNGVIVGTYGGTDGRGHVFIRTP